MKEKKITNKTIINKLAKQNYIELCPICDECIADLVPLILQYFGSVNFNITIVEDNLYSLKISL